MGLSPLEKMYEASPACVDEGIKNVEEQKVAGISEMPATLI